MGANGWGRGWRAAARQLDGSRRETAPLVPPLLTSPVPPCVAPRPRCKQTHQLAAALLHGCCFPALALLRQRDLLRISTMAASPPPPADLAAADAAAERCVAASRAQHAQQAGGSSSREAAFELLLDLAVHDSGCWRYVQDQLTHFVHTAAVALLPQLFNNVPLQALRPPK